MQECLQNKLWSYQLHIRALNVLRSHQQQLPNESAVGEQEA